MSETCNLSVGPLNPAALTEMNDSSQLHHPAEFDEQTREDRKTFFPVLVAGCLYVLTILIYVAAMMGDSSQPIELRPTDTLRQSILTHGLTAIVMETILLATVSVRAMAQDRRITLARLQAQTKTEQDTLASSL